MRRIVWVAVAVALTGLAGPVARANICNGGAGLCSGASPKAFAAPASGQNLPSLSISNGHGAETEGPIFEGEECFFDVHRSGPANKTSKVHYKTKDGTASASDGDYTPTQGTLTFAPGERDQTIVVKTFDVDDDGEGEDQSRLETFSITLSNPTNATIGDEKGVCKIREASS